MRSDRMGERVVVTGLGVVSALGDDADRLAAGLLEGHSAAQALRRFDASAFSTRFAAEIDHPAWPAELPDRKQAFALAAARSAIEHAQRQGQALARRTGRNGVSLGIGLELFSMPDMLLWLAAPGQARATLRQDPQFLVTAPDHCVHEMAREHGLSLPPWVHISACAASTDAIGHAFRRLREGRADWMLAGGADSMINPMGFAGFCKIQAMSTRNDAPREASRPFDRRRDGFVLGEGAAMLLLETEAHARRRGAAVLAELLGYGNSFDAHGISEPHPQGLGAGQAMRRALADAGVEPAAVCHVNAHATSTPKNEPAEAAALRALFGAHVEQVSVNATKSMIGHAIAASGALELAAQIACARRGWLHATINLEEVDAECRLDHIVGAPRRWVPGGVMLKNSFAFGGQNACLVARL